MGWKQETCGAIRELRGRTQKKHGTPIHTHTHRGEWPEARGAVALRTYADYLPATLDLGRCLPVPSAAAGPLPTGRRRGSDFLNYPPAHVARPGPAGLLRFVISEVIELCVRGTVIGKNTAFKRRSYSRYERTQVLKSRSCNYTMQAEVEGTETKPGYWLSQKTLCLTLVSDRMLDIVIR